MGAPTAPAPACHHRTEDADVAPGARLRKLAHGQARRSWWGVKSGRSRAAESCPGALGHAVVEFSGKVAAWGPGNHARRDCGGAGPRLHGKKGSAVPVSLESARARQPEPSGRGSGAKRDFRAAVGRAGLGQALVARLIEDRWRRRGRATGRRRMRIWGGSGGW